MKGLVLAPHVWDFSLSAGLSVRVPPTIFCGLRKLHIDLVLKILVPWSHSIHLKSHLILILQFLKNIIINFVPIQILQYFLVKKLNNEGFCSPRCATRHERPSCGTSRINLQRLFNRILIGVRMMSLLLFVLQQGHHGVMCVPAREAFEIFQYQGFTDGTNVCRFASLFAHSVVMLPTFPSASFPCRLGGRLILLRSQFCTLLIVSRVHPKFRIHIQSIILQQIQSLKYFTLFPSIIQFIATILHTIIPLNKIPIMHHKLVSRKCVFFDEGGEIVLDAC
mmetsp:Transcript_2935/g.11202  ORF Transcript_2935/g.11202 Transcript_2935/m.11202 type:complete len:279 (-) Transcript_2935:95-931(-)